MLVHHMTLVSFRLLRKSLGNLREFLGKWFTVPPPPAKNCPYAYGYSFLSQQSCTDAGGVGFYVENNLGYIHRSDLSGHIQNDYESLWIEIQNDTGHNSICEFVLDTAMVV